MTGLPSYQTVSLVRTELPAGWRTLILSDIHGHAAALQKALRRAKFSPDDTLVVVGDLLEKGLGSLSVIRTLMALSETHRVFTLMGNMDVFTLSRLLSDDPEKRHSLFELAPKMISWWGGCLLMEMCGELGIPFQTGMDEAGTVREIRRHFDKELSFLTRLPTILDTPRMTFVHGGLPHLDFQEFVGKDSNPYLKCDDFLSKGLSFPKYLTVGHWPTVLYRDEKMDMSPLLVRERNILCLDGGCGVKQSGQLNCVIWEDPASDRFTFLWEDELPRVKALAGQEGSPSSTYIKFHDRDVTVLRKDGPDFTLVSWHGRTVRVPDTALDRDHPGRLNTDYTDYILPVRAGDTMSLVRTVGGRHYVRRDSVLGWYDGPLGPAEEGWQAPERPVPAV